MFLIILKCNNKNLVIKTWLLYQITDFFPFWFDAFTNLHTLLQSETPSATKKYI